MQVEAAREPRAKELRLSGEPRAESGAATPTRARRTRMHENLEVG